MRADLRTRRILQMPAAPNSHVSGHLKRPFKPHAAATRHSAAGVRVVFVTSSSDPARSFRVSHATCNSVAGIGSIFFCTKSYHGRAKAAQKAPFVVANHR